MFAYRFRINFEEQDGFSRDIDLQSDQTFLEFHNILSENLSLDKNLECTFYMCDHFYRKRKRIYQPGSTDKRLAGSDEEVQQKQLFMDECVLSDYIDDPHQKFIYVYDMEKDWSFYIELLKILPAAQNQQYPKIAASIGGIPMEINRKPIALPGIVDEDDLDVEDLDDAEEPDMPELVLDIDDESELDGPHSFEVEEVDLDAMDDSAFYDDSIEIEEEFDEGKDI
jgi:hypothetical protein